MDQTITLPDPTATAARPVIASPSAVSSGLSSDEEPESPGRSPDPGRIAPGPDPLSEGLAFLAGAAIALTTLLVPVLTVISEPRPADSSAGEPGRLFGAGR